MKILFHVIVNNKFKSSKDDDVMIKNDLGSAHVRKK